MMAILRFNWFFNDFHCEQRKTKQICIISFNEIIPLEKCTIIKFSSIHFRLVVPNHTIPLALISAWQSFLLNIYSKHITIECFNSVTIIAINFCCWPKIENKIHYLVLFYVFSLFLCFICIWFLIITVIIVMTWFLVKFFVNNHVIIFWHTLFVVMVSFGLAY